ncbi:hypothetical protein HYH02_011610 [Chlamydomonas schloesseri]|uniref:Wax synthase domain-containing protein n=1 Tax=Chlamydomonas schloesseri TaxID=2026947 RepID=A0A835T965_9CHLO|nr:hypothetical protein HYH02_011610 [Chlamydomonas schloesseri]|eukprot:KAG2436099.1 hypothetical protein HYH02_011610 [Chlamydomonas schloesseri]
MSAFKALALAQGRGCLAKPGLDLWTFWGVMLLPVIPLSFAPDRSKHGAIARRKVRSGLIKLVCFAGLVASTLWATHRVERLAASPSAPPLAALAAPWLLLACHWVGGMALLLEVDGCGDLTDAAALAGFGVAAEPHFDRVWLSSSFAELWGRRWNLTVSSVLKAAFYEPVMEGRFFADSPVSAAPSASGPSSDAVPTPADSSAATPFHAPTTPLAAAVAAAPATVDARPSRADVAAWAAAASVGHAAAANPTPDAADDDAAAGEHSTCTPPHGTSPASSRRSLSDAGSIGSALPSEWSTGHSTAGDAAARACSGTSGITSFRRESVTSVPHDGNNSPSHKSKAGAAQALAGDAAEKSAGMAAEVDEAPAGGSELRRRRHVHQHHHHHHQHTATEPDADSAAKGATAAVIGVLAASQPPPPPPAPPSIARSSVGTGTGTGTSRGGPNQQSRARRFLAGLLTFFASGVWHELVAFTMTGRTTGGSWLLLFTLQAVILTAESELRKATRRAGVRVPLWAARVMTQLLFMTMLSLLWYPPMRSTGMIDALVAQGDRAAAAASAAAARLEAALLPAVAAVVPAGTSGAEGLRAWLLSAVAAL